MNKRALLFIVVVWYCDGSFDSFCFMQFHSEILPLRDFIVRYLFRAICSCDFAQRCHLRVNLPPSRGLDSEICVCKLAEKASPLVYFDKLTVLFFLV
jgi:hypothetical protein